MTTPEKEFFNKITDVSNVPFAMAVLNDKGEITEYGPYQVEFANEIPHIPLYTTPQIKELSDEKIDECVEKIAKEDDFYPEEIPSDKFLKCFARAILKKANEK